MKTEQTEQSEQTIPVAEPVSNESQPGEQEKTYTDTSPQQNNTGFFTNIFGTNKQATGGGKKMKKYKKTKKNLLKNKKTKKKN